MDFFVHIQFWIEIKQHEEYVSFTLLTKSILKAYSIHLFTSLLLLFVLARQAQMQINCAKQEIMGSNGGKKSDTAVTKSKEYSERSNWCQTNTMNHKRGL